MIIKGDIKNRINMEMKRDLTLDYARGFAMVLIVLGHLYFYSGRWNGSWAYLICSTVHIPVFMYISGLLAHRSIDRYGFRKLVANRAVRLLLPLFSFYILWSIYNPDNFIQIPIREYKRGFWFMIVLFEFMVSLSLIKRVSSITNIPSYVLNASFYGLITLYLFLIPSGRQFNILFCVNLFWHFYPFFMLGYYSYKIYHFLKLYLSPVYLLMFAISLYCLQVYGMKWMAPIGNLSSLLFLISVFKNGIRPLEPFFVKLGIYSLQIYMIHFTLLFLVLRYLPIIDSRWLEFGIYLGVSILIIIVTIGIARILMMSSLVSLLLFGIKKK